MRKITISLSNWVYDLYISGYNGNRSRYIEELLVKGFQIETGELTDLNQKILKLTMENRNLKEKCRVLERNTKGKKILSDKLKFSKSLKNAGVLR